MNLDFNNIIPELHYYIHRKPTPNWKIDPSIIQFTDISYVVKGKAKYTIGDREYIVKKGDLICIPQNTYRAASTIPEDLVESYATNIILRDHLGNLIDLPFPVVSHIGIIPELVSLFHDIHSDWIQKDFGYMLKIRGILCLILYQLANILLNENDQDWKDPRIESSIQYINLHYSEPLSIDVLAKHFHLHPVYYGNLFQNTMKMTFKQYLTLLRLNTAENMLKSGEYSVSEVALQCGFSDLFYFSKLFKQKKGIAPSSLFAQGTRKSINQ